MTEPSYPSRQIPALGAPAQYMRCRFIAASQPFCVCPAPCVIWCFLTDCKVKPNLPIFTSAFENVRKWYMALDESKMLFTLFWFWGFGGGGFFLLAFPLTVFLLMTMSCVCKTRQSRRVCVKEPERPKQGYGYVLRHGRPSRMRNPKTPYVCP